MRLAAPIALAALVLAAAGPAAAQDFTTQSPGALSRSHAQLGGQDHCDDCHDGGRALSAEKCLGCHTQQRAAIRSGTGLHVSRAVARRPCWNCHLEHRGRDHDVMGWAAIGGRDKFDHILAGWPLGGKHAVTPCDSCHRRRDKAGLRVYLGEAARCEGCHAREQPHGFPASAPGACRRCHGDVAWKPAVMGSFDHDRDTDYDLEGTHRDVACAKCHPRSKFELGAGAADCARCHKSPHDGHLFGARKCELCHSPTLRSLSSVRFDHGKATRFALEGKHRRTECYACHPERSTRAPRRECEGCHARDSRHGDRFASFGSPPACAHVPRGGVALAAAGVRSPAQDRVLADGDAREGGVPVVPPRAPARPVRAVRRAQGRLPGLPRPRAGPRGQVHRRQVPHVPPRRRGADHDHPRPERLPRAGLAIPADRGARPGGVRRLPPRRPLAGALARVRAGLPRRQPAPGIARPDMLSLPRRRRVGRHGLLARRGRPLPPARASRPGGVPGMSPAPAVPPSPDHLRRLPPAGRRAPRRARARLRSLPPRDRRAGVRSQPPGPLPPRGRPPQGGVHLVPPRSPLRRPAARLRRLPPRARRPPRPVRHRVRALSRHPRLEERQRDPRRRQLLARGRP